MKASHARGSVDSRAIRAAMQADHAYDRRHGVREGSMTDQLVDGAVRKGARAAVKAVRTQLRKGK